MAGELVIVLGDAVVPVSLVERNRGQRGCEAQHLDALLAGPLLKLRVDLRSNSFAGYRREYVDGSNLCSDIGLVVVW